MTPETSQQFRLNESTIARFSGFMPLKKVEACEICDCEDRHECGECGNEISVNACREYGGHCADCSFLEARSY